MKPPIESIPADPPLTAPAKPDAKFLNRELTWLEFNRRVLTMALDPRTPLLERVGFLAIFNSNLDEFYQKRVGGLQRQIDSGYNELTPDGLSPQQQLDLIRQMVEPMLLEQGKAFTEHIKPKLREEGIALVSWDDLLDAERIHLEEDFKRNLFPVLTPLSVDPGHPFPFISNLSTSLGVMIRSLDGGDEQLQFARVKVPEVLPGWLKLPAELTRGTDVEGQTRFIKLETVIRRHLHLLFEGMSLEEIEPFRVTRNATIGSEADDDAEDLLERVEAELKQRRFADVVRLEVDDEPFRPLNQFLIGEMHLDEQDVYEMPAELDYNPLWTIHGVQRPDLKFTPWTPLVPPRLADEDADMFSVIRAGDVMVHHPYESFSASVERFIRTAATDPDVLTIKLTLYRTADDSPFIPYIIRAAESGKQVVVLVELNARFDEQRNVQLAQKLEKAGIHVVYGVVGLKTHTKTSLVVRRESEGIRAYAHIGTGNYHSKTANLYTDLGLFTADPRITADLTSVFHFLTGRSATRDFSHLLIAPINMRRRFEEMIDREIAHTAAWKANGADPADPNRPALVAKMNSLEDKLLCEKLYEASNAGVQIDLIVRGFCCLRPQVPGLSDNIRVVSVIGRFLEHSRIYHFRNNGEPEYYIGSADWMYRNLNNRVECITPIYDVHHQARLQQIIDIMLADQRQAWDMNVDGTYTPRYPDPDKPETEVGTHRALMHLHRAHTDPTSPV
ncbi:MAG: polyphosphate kinase 1 [Planctomycetota bacterium]